MKLRPSFTRKLAIAAWLAAIVPTAVLAQPIYRHLDRNGQVVFSDQAPAANAQPVAPSGASTLDGGAAGLTYELRQVMQRYPITVYTRDDCEPCDAGRALLVARGIPFDERQVKTNADNEALRRLSGQDALPLLTIGTQQLKGFGDAEWSQYLDAAGYPKSIALPAGYRRSAAQPLVALTPATPVTATTRDPVPAANPPAPATPVPRGQTPQNPAGIQF
ncbi:MAG TPA: glutaredoxin family protein [Variovorax sp.]|nr:glutaredoxin family protein [Variovorax sp.]